MDDTLRSKIADLIAKHRVVVFMKGSAMMPMCGFSATALQTLRAAGAAQIATHDVLKDQALREGIKEYTSWPTIPQVFIGGKFIGGCDILKELHERGELAKLLAEPA